MSSDKLADIPEWAYGMALSRPSKCLEAHDYLRLPKGLHYVFHGFEDADLVLNTASALNCLFPRQNHERSFVDVKLNHHRQ